MKVAGIEQTGKLQYTPALPGSQVAGTPVRLHHERQAAGF